MDKEKYIINRAQNSNINIVKQSDSETDLNQSYIDYKSQPRKKQREADWEMLDLYGIDNKERYEELEAGFLKKDLEPDNDLVYDGTGMMAHVSEINEEAIDNYNVNFSDINYPETAIDAALDWAHNSMRVIIVPKNNLDDLDDLWHKFNDMIKKHRRESDWKSEELFGVNNQTHYEYLRSKLLKKDIDTDPDDTLTSADDCIAPTGIESDCGSIPSDVLPAVERCLELSNRKNLSLFENMVVDTYVDDTIEQFKDNIAINTEIPMDDLPFFDPEEMSDLGIFGQDKNYYGVVADNNKLGGKVTTEQWFKNYKLLFNGIATEDTKNYAIMRINKIKELYLDFDQIKESGDVDKINSRKQSILELGWNPEIDFNIENRIAANDRIKSIMKSKYGIKIINSQNLINALEESSKINENNFIYLAVIVEDNWLILNISYNPSFETMYRYNTNIALTIDKYSIKHYNVDTNMQVYGIYLEEKYLNKLKKAIDYFNEDSDNTEPIIDKIDTFTDIDISIIISNLINRLIDAVPKRSVVYKLYDGTIRNYTYDKINTFMNSLVSSKNVLSEASMINEETILSEIYDNINNPEALKVLFENENYINKNSMKVYNNILRPYIDIDYIREAKEFPVQFDDDGNLLIKKIKKIDFEAEYARSHQLLKQYEKVESLNNIKYELSKLWFFNHILQSRLYKKQYEKDKAAINKARAKILNDFYKYLNYVLEREKDFSFNDYYESSPFSDAAYKVNKSTLKYSAKAIKDIILGLK